MSRGLFELPFFEHSAYVYHKKVLPVMLGCIHNDYEVDAIGTSVNYFLVNPRYNNDSKDGDLRHKILGKVLDYDTKMQKALNKKEEHGPFTDVEIDMRNYFEDLKWAVFRCSKMWELPGYWEEKCRFSRRLGRDNKFD